MMAQSGTGSQKQIRLTGHALQQLRFRGTNEAEVAEAIRTAKWGPAEFGRLDCRKDFLFDAIWNGVHYARKQVRSIFVDEPDEIKGEAVRITYDREVDALYIRFKETTVTTKHLAEGIAADYDAEGRLAGIEILDAVKRLGDPTVFKQVVLEDVALGKQ